MQAEAEATAILRVNEAVATSLKLLNEANPADSVIKIKALEAFQAAANGKATKIIIPSEIRAWPAWPRASWRPSSVRRPALRHHPEQAIISSCRLKSSAV